MKKESIRKIVENASTEELIQAWNDYCEDISYYDDVIYTNDNDGYETMFNDIDEALRASYYGEFEYTDQYAYLNGYGNLVTFSYVYDTNCPIDTEQLVDWMVENQNTADYIDYDPLDYEDDDDYEDDEENDEEHDNA